MKKQCFAAAVAGMCLASVAETAPQSPYGICAHVTRGEPVAQEAPMMKRAGIDWVRSDFDMHKLFASQNPAEWKLAYYEPVIAECEKNGVQLLPILGCPPKYAYPAHEHLDLWKEMVRRTVLQYGNRLPSWEVWNEENIPGFWKNPNSTNYCALLKETYKTVKSVNPNLQVLFGGTAGVPYAFIEEVYDTGGKDFFDAMNIHPYSQPNPPEISLEERIAKLRAIMTRHGDEKKPMWITEIGWPTPSSYVLQSAPIFRNGLRKLNPDKAWKIGILDDRAWSAAPWPETFFLPGNWPKDAMLLRLAAPEMQTVLKNNTVDAVLISVGEGFPLELFDDTVSFVKNGGVLLQAGMFPFWYGHKRTASGKWERPMETAGGPGLAARLRLGLEAWWTNKKLAEGVSVSPVNGAEEGMSPAYSCSRFIKPGALKDGDKFIPLLGGKAKEGYNATGAALVDFNSDWKGALIVSCLQENFLNAADENISGELLPRAALIAFQSGVEKFFWYEFQAPEHDEVDPESHFGIVHRDLQPKPGYSAYWALAKKRPAGSQVLHREWKDEARSLYFPQWRLPNGKTSGAVWSLYKPGFYKVSFSKKPANFCNHLGRYIQPPIVDGNAAILQLTGSLIYFEDAEIKSIEAVK